MTEAVASNIINIPAMPDMPPLFSKVSMRYSDTGNENIISFPFVRALEYNDFNYRWVFPTKTTVPPLYMSSVSARCCMTLSPSIMQELKEQGTNWTSPGTALWSDWKMCLANDTKIGHTITCRDHSKLAITVKYRGLSRKSPKRIERYNNAVNEVITYVVTNQSDIILPMIARINETLTHWAEQTRDKYTSEVLDYYVYSFKGYDGKKEGLFNRAEAGTLAQKMETAKTKYQELQAAVRNKIVAQAIKEVSEFDDVHQTIIDAVLKALNEKDSFVTRPSHFGNRRNLIE